MPSVIKSSFSKEPKWFRLTASHRKDETKATQSELRTTGIIVSAQGQGKHLVRTCINARRAILIHGPITVWQFKPNIPHFPAALLSLVIRNHDAWTRLDTLFPQFQNGNRAFISMPTKISDCEYCKTMLVGFTKL